ncbi:hypothetical protein FPZ12_039700 [Amycolatopsis acidicola]|uniref:DUF1579 domain-containing protein n=1 Tax=Amycolatopsis acidicola TaxID=2596893 RepID=A0A5N0USX5_9PSEU|nr:hypothetical protein [Amycolatopsis acidicola]KAA9151099.1 hypothetical protein FPZ12_039700 [Amycolatopsis acidicola]
MKELEVFVGEWSVEARFPGASFGVGPSARCTCEWLLGGQYLVQRTEISLPDAPDSYTVIAAGEESGRYTQHYFDSRGVTRLYAMTFENGVWTLSRESADFSSFDFAQRFTGTFSADGNRIDGLWEKAFPGSGWELDFELSYTRA